MRELRLHTALPIRVAWADDGKTTSHSACTIDVSQRGARLTGVTGLKSGQLIAIRRKTSEARFRVVWVGKPQSAQAGQVGVESLDVDKTIWDVDFDKVPEGFEPLSDLGRSALPSYRFTGKVSVWPERGIGGLETELRAIGNFSCEVAGAIDLAGPLVLQIYTENTEITVKGIAQPMQKGTSLINFTHIRRGDRRMFQDLISRISR
jgi:hypothetical protein